jgi:hypothetical protein
MVSRNRYCGIPFGTGEDVVSGHVVSVRHSIELAEK